MKKMFGLALILVMGLSGGAIAQDCTEGEDLFVLQCANSYGHSANDVPPVIGSSLDVVGGIAKTQDNAGAPLVFDLDTNVEYTIHITGVDLDSWVDDADPAENDTFYYNQGGTIKIYEHNPGDAACRPAASPPNASVPGTFNNGTEILSGSIENLFVTEKDNTAPFGPDRVGEVRGDVEFSGGTRFGELISPVWVWNATVNTGFFGTVPAGYNWDWAGELKNACPPPVSTETTSWGTVKGLFR